jgi:hypothetical protein
MELIILLAINLVLFVDINTIFIFYSILNKLYLLYFFIKKTASFAQCFLKAIV